MITGGRGPGSDACQLSTLQSAEEHANVKLTTIALHWVGRSCGRQGPSAPADVPFPLNAGDQLILGTHGLFDMVWLHGSPSTNLRR
jgi:hypothetical protein